jgi:phosphatidylserine/phosphatidylglycerophosphate/cardiolipin synthase-like enzyme
MRSCALTFVACASASPSIAMEIPKTSLAEVGFSPDGSAWSLVIRTIDSAHQSIRLAAYSFTASFVVEALLAAKKRGVDVSILVDFKDNVVDDKSGHARPALDALVNAGISVRSISAYRKQHNKFMVVDGKHVETGSFNYAESARENAENVLVLLNFPELAGTYSANWQTIFDQGQPYSPGD